MVENLSEFKAYTMYTKSGCQWCDRLKEFMRSKKLPFEEVRIDAAVENLSELRSLYPGVQTVPQLFLNGVRIGGYTESVDHFLSDDSIHLL